MRAKIVFLAVGLVLCFILAFSTSVRAEDSSFSSPEPTRTPGITSFFSRNSETPDPSESPEPSETPRVKGVDRLEGLRLDFCQKHEDEVNTRLTSLGNLVANILGKFDAIAARVEQFYTNKVVPTGKTVPNYTALLADITAKRAAAQTALTNAQSDVTTFSCTSTNPKGEIRQFRLDMQSVKKALQDYRTSIKNLIVAVRSVTGETESESPKPTETPEVTVSPTATPTAVPTATPI